MLPSFFNQKEAGIVLYRKKNNFPAKKLAFSGILLYTNTCCGIDSDEARGCCLRLAGFSVERMSS